MSQPKILGSICAFVLAVILVAGLLPFQRPKNQVTWLENQNGLHFGRMGTLVSSGTFGGGSANKEASCSLEFWVKSAASHGTSSLLTFSTSENPLQLWVHQYRVALVVKRLAGEREREHSTIGVDNVFGRSEPVFVTITSGAQKTSIYIDGRLAESAPGRHGDWCGADAGEPPGVPRPSGRPFG